MSVLLDTFGIRPVACGGRHAGVSTPLAGRIAARRTSAAVSWRRAESGPAPAALRAPAPGSSAALRAGTHALVFVSPGRSARRLAGHGRLAQRESASFTPRRSLVRSQYRPQTEILAGQRPDAGPRRLPLAGACPILGARREPILAGSGPVRCSQGVHDPDDRARGQALTFAQRLFPALLQDNLEVSAHGRSDGPRTAAHA